MPALAFCVHILTACGAALALMAMLLATSEEWPLMFGVLGIALIVDAADGPLARKLRVTDLAPRWSGEVLDLVVDFLTYVFVPAYAIMVAGLMPPGWSIVSGIAIVVSGALYFADREMKTTDNSFQGFPAVWNVVAFYMLLLRPEPWNAAATVAVFVALIFVPVRFVHPFRVRYLRQLNIALVALWSLLALAALAQDLKPDFWIAAALCAIGAYFLLVGLLPRRDGHT